MTWAKLLEEEYRKIAKNNSLSNINSDRQKSDTLINRTDERVERIKAKERQNLGQKSDEGRRTDDTVANNSGFGSRDTYNKAKFISDNADEEMIKAKERMLNPMQNSSQGATRDLTSDKILSNVDSRCADFFTPYISDNASIDINKKPP